MRFSGISSHIVTAAREIPKSLASLLFDPAISTAFCKFMVFLKSCWWPVLISGFQSFRIASRVSALWPLGNRAVGSHQPAHSPTRLKTELLPYLLRLSELHPIPMRVSAGQSHKAESWALHSDTLIHTELNRFLTSVNIVTLTNQSGLV